MEAEVKKLKEMLSIHLDIVQHQMDQATFRESQMKALKKENQMLLQKMERMERRLMTHHLTGPHHQKRPRITTTTTTLPPPPPVVLADNSQQQQQQITSPANVAQTPVDPKPVDTRSTSDSESITSSMTSRSTQTSPQRVTGWLLAAGRKRVGRKRRRCFGVVRNRMPNGCWSRVLPLPVANDSSAAPRAASPLHPLVSAPAVPSSPPSIQSADQCVESSRSPMCRRRTSKRFGNRSLSALCQPAVFPPAQADANCPANADADAGVDTDVGGCVANGAAQPSVERNVQAGRHSLLLQGESLPAIPSCMVTQLSYHVTTDQCGRLSSEETKQLISNSRQATVEVPCWQLCTFTASHTVSTSASTTTTTDADADGGHGADSAVSAGECLADETFLRRHSKPELHEKRRKRWDLQRVRQQHHYEKLRSAYQRRNHVTSSNNATCEPTQSDTNAPSPTADGNRLSSVAASLPPVRQMSLCPRPDCSTFIVVDESVPVCCFGTNLPPLRLRSFRLPWKTDRSSL